jgi:acyl-CoA thioesterase-2
MNGNGCWDQQDLTELLTLEPVGERGWRSYVNEGNTNGRVFGGQLLGQALWAASRTALGRSPAMLQMTFLQGARPQRVLEYSIDALQDGRRLATRHIYGVQNTGLIVSANASFQSLPAEAAPGQYLAFPVAEPENLPGLAQLAERYPNDADGVQARWHARPFLDIRPVAADDYMASRPPGSEVAHWVRLKQPLSDEGALHHAALAYLSDTWLHAGMAPSLGLLQLWQDCYCSSLNHTLWFHQPRINANDWLLFVCQWVPGAAGRHLVTAHIYQRDGLRVASMAQDVLVSPRGS